MDKDLVKQYISYVVANEDEKAREVFSAFCSQKARTMIETRNDRLDECRKYIVENAVAPITMDGDYIVVNGKKVGRVQIDLNNFDSGIDFVANDENFSKEFETAEDLFKFVAQRYLGEK